jgi:DNA repair exonuclease SbcCD ATPase subunit
LLFLKQLHSVEGVPAILSLNELSDGTALWKLFEKIVGTGSLDNQLTTTQSPLARKFCIQKLVEQLRIFCQSYLQVDIGNDLQKINLDVIAQGENGSKEYKDQIIALLQIFLYVATNGPKNAEINLKILTLSPEDQRVLMFIIEKKIQQYEETSMNSNYNVMATPVKRLAALVLSSPDSRAANEHRNSSETTDYKKLYEKQRDEFQSLAQINRQLQEDKENFHKEKKAMLKEISYLEECNSKLKQECQRLTQRLAELEEKEKQREDKLFLSSPLDTEKLRRENEELKEILREKEKTLLLLKSEVSKCSQYKSEIQNLKDELDITKEKADSAKQLETKLNKANIKLASLQNLKQTVKKLEADNDSLLHEKVRLQETSQREINNLRRKIECYEKQIFETSKRITQLEFLSGQKEAEVAHLRERVTLLEQEVATKDAQLKVAKELKNSAAASLTNENCTPLRTPMKTPAQALMSKSPECELLAEVLMTPSRKESLLREEERQRLQTPPHVKQERDELNSRIEFVTQQYQQLQHEYLLQVESLKKEIENRNTIIESLKSQISEHLQEVQILNEKLSKNQSFTKKLEESFRNKLHEYVAKLSTAENHIVELEAEKQILQKEVETLKDQQQQHRGTDPNFCDMKEGLNSNTAELINSEFQQKIEEQRKLINEQQVKIQEQNKQFEQLRQIYEESKQMQMEETASLEKEKKMLLEEVTQMKSELEKTLCERLQLQNQLQQQCLQMEEHKKTQEKLKHEIQQYQELCCSLEKKCQQMMNSLKQNEQHLPQSGDNISLTTPLNSGLSSANTSVTTSLKESIDKIAEDSGNKDCVKYEDLVFRENQSEEMIQTQRENELVSMSLTQGQDAKEIPTIRKNSLWDKENDPSSFTINNVPARKDGRTTFTKSLGPARRVHSQDAQTTHRLSRLAAKALANHGIRLSLKMQNSTPTSSNLDQ